MLEQVTVQPGLHNGGRSDACVDHPAFTRQQQQRRDPLRTQQHSNQSEQGNHHQSTDRVVCVVKESRHISLAPHGHIRMSPVPENQTRMQKFAGRRRLGTEQSKRERKVRKWMQFLVSPVPGIEQRVRHAGVSRPHRDERREVDDCEVGARCVIIQKDLPAGRHCRHAVVAHQHNVRH